MGASAFPPECVPFCASQAREVNPAELVGKTVRSIRPGPTADAPHTVSFLCSDGSEFEVRVAGLSSTSETYIEYAIRDADVRGRRITGCSLMRCAVKDDDDSDDGKFSPARVPALGISSSPKHIALGIKFEGSNRWHVLEGYESDWDSDSDCIDASEYRRVYIVRSAGRRRSTLFRRVTGSSSISSGSSTSQ